MFSARSPSGPALFRGDRWPSARLGRRLRRAPQLAAGKPFHDDVGILAFQLMKGWQQFFGFARTEGRGVVVNQDCPIREARWHLSIVSGIRSVSPVVGARACTLCAAGTSARVTTAAANR